jgi:phosphomevalonate kinase
LETNDSSRILNAITQNRKALKQLGEEANIPIQTSRLSTLAKLAEAHGGAGKPSGAGAGDCEIALIANRKADKLNTDWLQAGVQPLFLHVTDSGVNVRWLMD